MLINQFRGFLVFILIGAGFISAIVGEVTDAVVILLIVVLNAILGVIQESKLIRLWKLLRKWLLLRPELSETGKQLK